MEPATFDDTGSWIDNTAHFEACSSINMWNDKQRDFYLVASLRGEAQKVQGNMHSDNACAYKDVCDALETRSPQQTKELYQGYVKSEAPIIN